MNAGRGAKKRKRIAGALVLLMLCLPVPSALAEEEPNARERSQEYYDEMARIGFFSAATKGLFESADARVVDPNRPMVALTFDDGPADNTARILQMLTAHDGRATFFLTGNRIANYAQTVQQIHDQGSEIGTHTWSHKDLTKLGRDGASDELSKGMQAIEGITGQPVTLARPPYGSHNEAVRDIAGGHGLVLVNWSIDTEDWRTRQADRTVSAILDSVANGHIILCHDTVEETADAMDIVIPALVERGYQLVTVTEMLEAAGAMPAAGTLVTRLKAE